MFTVWGRGTSKEKKNVCGSAFPGMGGGTHLKMEHGHVPLSDPLLRPTGGAPKDPTKPKIEGKSVFKAKILSNFNSEILKFGQKSSERPKVWPDPGGGALNFPLVSVCRAGFQNIGSRERVLIFLQK